MSAPLFVQAELLHRLAARVVQVSDSRSQHELRATLEAVRRGADAMLGDLPTNPVGAPRTNADISYQVLYISDRARSRMREA